MSNITRIKNPLTAEILRYLLDHEWVERFRIINDIAQKVSPNLASRVKRKTGGYMGIEQGSKHLVTDSIYTLLKGGHLNTRMREADTVIEYSLKDRDDAKHILIHFDKASSVTSKNNVRKPQRKSLSLVRCLDCEWRKSVMAALHTKGLETSLGIFNVSFCSKTKKLTDPESYRVCDIYKESENATPQVSMF